MRYAFPHLNSMRDASSSQLFCFAQTRRTYAQSRFGVAASMCALVRLYEAGESNVLGMPTAVPWKVDCAPPTMHAYIPMMMVRWTRWSRCAGISGPRRRNERETLREGAGPASVRLKRAAMCMCRRIQRPVREYMMHCIGVRSGQCEVSDKCIDEQGCRGSTPSASPCRCVETAVT
ncbi:hypothetical protein B0H13DRAFT_2048229 [Mycena leptocephala]|nr:hypothetical protein B0H13DRAFT_2048229 [Mycena leptocephala]